MLLACLGIGFLLWVGAHGGWRTISLFGLNFLRPREKTTEELQADREDQKSRAGARRRQLEVAFARYAEAAVGMVPMVEAVGPADRTLGAWFDVAAAGLAAALTVYPEDHYRVAIWADLGDPATFTLLGAANHNRLDAEMNHLSKADTIGGHAWASKKKAGEYLCSDVAKDRKFKSRSGRAKPYAAIFAIRIGEPSRSWGVMTIDAPRNSFDDQALLIVRRFAQLISAGAAVAIARYSPAPGRPTQRDAPGPARIVTPSLPQLKEPADDDQPR